MASSKNRKPSSQATSDARMSQPHGLGIEPLDSRRLREPLGGIDGKYSSLDSFLIEGTHKFGKSSVYARFEHTEVETEILLFPQVVHVPHPGWSILSARSPWAPSETL